MDIWFILLKTFFYINGGISTIKRAYQNSLYSTNTVDSLMFCLTGLYSTNLLIFKLINFGN